MQRIWMKLVQIKDSIVRFKNYVVGLITKYPKSSIIIFLVIGFIIYFGLELKFVKVTLMTIS